jgi:hypothetical protein
MTTATDALPPGHSAQILAFPLRERMASKAGREQKFAMMEATARRHAGVASASGWYHDEAVAEHRDNTH